MGATLNPSWAFVCQELSPLEGPALGYLMRRRLTLMPLVSNTSLQSIREDGPPVAVARRSGVSANSTNKCERAPKKTPAYSAGVLCSFLNRSQ